MNDHNDASAHDLCLEYFGGDELATDVFLKKYALRDDSGKLLEQTPKDMHRRLAAEFARIEKKYVNPMQEDEIFGLLDGFKYVIPQGSPMAGIGNAYKLQSLSNCFVIDSPADSYGGILHTDQEQAQIMKRRGGVGFDISTIRPKGQVTANAARTTDGIGVFMERFSNTCREVAQGGRRGALMLTIDVRHPEIETFINIKRDLKKVTGANVSIKLTDDFMRAVKGGTEFKLQWPIDSDSPSVVQSVDAKSLWDQMIDAAWSSAEPGLLFWDTVIRETPADAFTDYGFGSISTNPCAELVLCKYDSCRLLLLNVSSYIIDAFTANARFDFELFHDHVMKAQRLMDDLVDLEIEQIDKIIGKINDDPENDVVKSVEFNLWNKIRAMAVNGRRTGLGLTGLGDCLAFLNLKYGSAESQKMTDEIYRALATGAHESSVILATERGAFPLWKPGVWSDHPFMNRLTSACSSKTNAMFEKSGRRNICLTTTAPAGSVSVMTKTTSGIEPAYMLNYRRRRKLTQNDMTAKVDFVDEMGDRWQEYDVFHPGVERWMAVTGNSFNEIKQSPYYGATSADVDWEASVDIQACAQRWIEHSLSKTCNLPSSASKELVSSVYMRAWEKGCKGFTVYRDGSRAGVLISSEENVSVNKHVSKKRPVELPCKIHHVNIKGEAWTVFVGLLDGKPYEVFGGLSRFVEIPKNYDEGVVIKNKRKSTNSVYDLVIGNGSGLKIKNIVDQFDNANHSATTRLISLALRHGANVQYVVEQLQKDRDSDMFSFAKCIARVLKSYIEDGALSTIEKKCESCGGDKFAYLEGCVSCVSCGWSKC